MFEVDTLFVVATRRGSYVAHDLIRSIRWSSQQSHYTVVVDLAGDVEPLEDLKDGHGIIRASVGKAADGFGAGLGLQWAFDKGIQARQYVILSDACLLLRQGVDTWALPHMQKTQVGLLGVIDRLNVEDAYGKCASFFDSWNAPHHNLSPGPETLHEACLWLSNGLATAMYQKGLFTPEGCENWPLPYGPYISWTAQMLGFYQVGWGHMDKRLPPLYVNHTGRARHQPEPHILSAQFLVYYSARHCVSYTEENLREAYKRMRGEPAKTVDPWKPSVSPKPLGPVD